MEKKNKKKIFGAVIVVLVILVVLAGFILISKKLKLKSEQPEIQTKKPKQTEQTAEPEQTTEDREKLLKASQGDEWKIHSETQIGDFIFSAAYSPKEIGIKTTPIKSEVKQRLKAFHETGFIKTTENIDLSGVFHYMATDRISDFFRDDGEYYYVFWTNRPGVDYAEITYTINGKELEPIRYDAKKIFYSKVPVGDYSFQLVYYDKNGNAYNGDPCIEETNKLNERVMIDGKMYWSTGRISDRKHKEQADGKITSTVSNWKSPTKDDQSNFGIYGLYGNDHPYNYIDDRTVEVFIDRNWVIFETIWDMTFSAENVTSTGLKLICTHSGNKTESNFHTKGNYWIEKKTDGVWEEVPMIAEVVWNDDEVYFLPEHESTTIDINWESAYGELQAGEYRIGKDLIWLDGNEYLIRVRYADFVIK